VCVGSTVVRVWPHEFVPTAGPNRDLHGELGHVAPAEYEATF
jgi:hypothetical protein